MLKIATEALAVIHRHAAEGYPLEICGFLVGSASDGARCAREAWPVRNAWEEDPEQRAEMLAAREAGGASIEQWEEHSTDRRFSISPQDTANAMKRAREAGVELIGLYHTHPDHPAVPSAFDRAAAWPEWSYVILSVRGGGVAEVRSWEILDFDDPFTEESWEEA